MIERIPQRSEDDCVICVVAMVMGAPYSYEKMLIDSQPYKKTCTDGTSIAWWERYLVDKGFQIQRCLTSSLHLFPATRGVVGILGMDMPHLKRGHLVAVDECGIIDPADNAPDHVSIPEYFRARRAQGVVFQDDFLAVRLKSR